MVPGRHALAQSPTARGLECLALRTRPSGFFPLGESAVGLGARVIFGSASWFRCGNARAAIAGRFLESAQHRIGLFHCANVALFLRTQTRHDPGPRNVAPLKFLALYLLCPNLMQGPIERYPGSRRKWIPVTNGAAWPISHPPWLVLLGFFQGPGRQLVFLPMLEGDAWHDYYLHPERIESYATSTRDLHTDFLAISRIQRLLRHLRRDRAPPRLSPGRKLQPSLVGHQLA